MYGFENSAVVGLAPTVAGVPLHHQHRASQEADDQVTLPPFPEISEEAALLRPDLKTKIPDPELAKLYLSWVVFR
jgi:hypothetical protein